MTAVSIPIKSRNNVANFIVSTRLSTHALRSRTEMTVSTKSFTLAILALSVCLMPVFSAPRVRKFYIVRPKPTNSMTNSATEMSNVFGVESTLENGTEINDSAFVVRADIWDQILKPWAVKYVNVEEVNAEDLSFPALLKIVQLKPNVTLNALLPALKSKKDFSQEKLNAASNNTSH